MKSKILNSKAYQVFDYICRLIILNILLIVISFSIFIIFSNIFPDMNNTYKALLLIPTAVTFFPALVSVFSVIKEYETIKSTGVLKEFFRGFKKYYFKTLLFSILIIGVFMLVSNSYSFFNSLKETELVYMMGYIITLSLILVLIIMIVHLPLVIIYFDGLSINHYLKLSFIFAFKDLGLTLLITALVIGSIILSFLFYPYLFIIGFSLTAYLIVKLTLKKYIKISERNK